MHALTIPNPVQPPFPPPPTRLAGRSGRRSSRGGQRAAGPSGSAAGPCPRGPRPPTPNLTSRGLPCRLGGGGGSPTQMHDLPPGLWKGGTRVGRPAGAALKGRARLQRTACSCCYRWGRPCRRRCCCLGWWWECWRASARWTATRTGPAAGSVPARVGGPGARQGAGGRRRLAIRAVLCRACHLVPPPQINGILPRSPWSVTLSPAPAASPLEGVRSPLRMVRVGRRRFSANRRAGGLLPVGFFWWVGGELTLLGWGSDAGGAWVYISCKCTPPIGMGGVGWGSQLGGGGLGEAVGVRVVCWTGGGAVGRGSYGWRSRVRSRLWLHQRTWAIQAVSSSPAHPRAPIPPALLLPPCSGNGLDVVRTR